MKRVGLIVVNTGGGKGKTTSALGMMLRSCGYDMKGVMIQFIKGSWFYGEKKSFIRLAPNFKLITAGRGFVGILDDKLPRDEHKVAAKKALDISLKEVRNRENDVVVLDEINYAVNLGLISEDDVIFIIEQKYPSVHLILTGNFATEKIIELADTVTEMKEIKHAYQKGKKAQIGIDY